MEFVWTIYQELDVLFSGRKDKYFIAFYIRHCRTFLE